jgi:DNA-binding transcriptional MocR family regulator
VSREPRLYGAAPSLPALIRFAAGEFDADGIRADTLTVVSGGLDGIDLVLREHLRPGDHVGVEDPVFPGLIDLLAAARLVPLPFAVDDDGPRPDAFEGVLKKRCHAVIVTPRAQNPTGAALTAGRVQDLRRILRKHPQTLVVEDDHAGPIAGAPAFTLSASMPRWAVIRSTAKFLGPDLRVAVVAGDPVTVARVEGRQALGMRWVSYILQQLALALWSDPASGRQLAHAANVYRQRREALLGAISKRGIQTHGRSGFNIWIPVPEEARVVHSLAASGWAVASGERFRLRTPPGIRVTTATLAPADADTLGQALSEVLPQRAAAFA